MNTQEVLNRIYENGVLPVIVIDDLETVIPLAKACNETGLTALEITFRSEHATSALKMIRNEYPDILLGAGTVLTVEQANQAIEAGADFIVTPGFNPDVVKHVVSKGFPIVPGISNASEIEQAMALGLDTVKFFPAEQAGGVPALKAFNGPYKKLRFIPTGGLTFDNFTSYTSLSSVVAIGGSFIVKKDHIAAKDVEAMKTDINASIDRMLGLKLTHIGINCESEEEALKTAKQLEQFFHMAYKIGNSSVFSGVKEFELMKKPGRGSKGHIAIAVSDIDRAMHFLSYRGVKFIEDSLVVKDNKKIAIYLADEMLGFAFHLVKA